MRRIISAVAVLCLGTAPVLLSGTAFAATTGSICGTVWQDINGDGIHQATEPAIPDVPLGIGPGAGVTSDGSGNYCFTNLAAGTYTVQAIDLSLNGGLGWTVQGHDSKVDWTNGKAAPITITAGQRVDGIDVGYLKSTDDVKPVQLLIDIDGDTRYASDQQWPTTPFHVGDVFTIEGSVEINGNVADQLGGTLTLPDGLTILNTAGGMPSFVANSHQVTGQFPNRRFAGDLEFVGATVRVDKPFTNGTLSITAGPAIFDTNNANNTLSKRLSAVATPPPAAHQPTTPHPTTTTTAAAVAPTTQPGGPTSQAAVQVTAATKALPNTGSSLVGPIAMGAALLLAGAGAFVIIARRRAKVRG